MPDDDEATLPDDGMEPVAPSPRRSLFGSIFTPRTSGRVTDPELRQRMRTLDAQERKFAWIAGGLSLILSLIIVPYLLHNTKTYQVESKKKPPNCAPYLHVGTNCELVIIHHPADFVLPFALVLGLSAILLFATYRSMRTLVLFTAFFVGLVISSFTFLGVLFFLFGAWLLIRSFRLQRYGTTDAATMRRVSAERAAARKEEKQAAKTPGTTATKAIVTPSKRYTPKSKSKSRRR